MRPNASSLKPRIYGQVPSIVTQQQIHKTQQKQNEVCNSWSFFCRGFHFLQLKEMPNNKSIQPKMVPNQLSNKKWPLDQEVVHPLQVSLLVQSLGIVSYHQNGASHRLLSQGGVLCWKFRVGFCSTKTWKDGKRVGKLKSMGNGNVLLIIFCGWNYMKFTFCWSICRLFGLIEFYRTMKRQFPIIKMASPIPNRDEVALVVLQMVDLLGRKCGEPCGFRILCQVGEPLNPFHWKRWFHCYVILMVYWRILEWQISTHLN